MTAILSRDEAHGRVADVDLVTYEVVRNRLNAIVAQQSLVLKNVSGSTLVTEANDCNTGIYLPDGGIVAMGPHNIFHSGTMELVVASIIEAAGEDGINEGDVFITNDPYKGALHLPDVTMLEPVFHEGARIGWVGSCAHVLDIGGMTSSSWCPDATEIYQEGLILPPTKVISGGKTRTDVWNLILSASRLPNNLGLDLRAMIASNDHARRGLQRVIERYGIEIVAPVMDTMLGNSERQIRERLRELPDGKFRARTYLDHDGRGDSVARVQVTMTKSGDHLDFDFDGTSPQVPGIYNCTLSGLMGGVFATVLPVLAHDIPWNSGVMRAITVRSPEATVVNAAHPAPCGAATVGAAQMVKNVAARAISGLVTTHDTLRSEAMAGTTGAIPIFHIGGLNQFGEGYGGALTDCLSGGGGATAAFDGIDYAGPYEILSYKVANVESDEAIFPVLYLRRELKTDSGGAGRNHGGCTLASSYTLHDADFLRGVMIGHSLSMPSTFGVHGGMPGATISMSVSRGTGVKQALAQGQGVTGIDGVSADVIDYASAPHEMMLAPGDVVDWSFTGGGGWGDPLDADPEHILAEVDAGRISLASAKHMYGVVTNGSDLDTKGTHELRNRTRAERRTWRRERVAPDEVVQLDGSERRVGERLVIAQKNHEWVYATDDGGVLSPVAENWKHYACAKRLTAEELGPEVRLHRELEAWAYSSPTTGVLLSVEIRWNKDEPLHDVELTAASYTNDT